HIRGFLTWTLIILDWLWTRILAVVGNLGGRGLRVALEFGLYFGLRFFEVATGFEQLIQLDLVDFFKSFGDFGVVCVDGGLAESSLQHLGGTCKQDARKSLSNIDWSRG